jgi:hypothetical protein
LKKRGTVFIVLLVVLLLLAGCGMQQSKDSGAVFPEESAPAAPAFDGDMKEGIDASFGNRAGEVFQDTVVDETGQKVIRNADLSLDVEDMDKTLADISLAVRQAGGIVANSSLSGRKGEDRSANLTLRVPQAHFDSFLDTVTVLGRQNSRNTAIRDVTLTYIDLEARIRNLEHQEERLLSVLDKADTVEDILRVEKELERVRGELESLTGEFRYLRDQVDYSTIQVYLRETPTASPVITGSGLRGVWQRGVEGLVNTVNVMFTGIGNMLVYLITILPFLAVLLLIIVPVIILINRLAKKGPRTPEL